MLCPRTGTRLAYAGRHLLLDLHDAQNLGDLAHIQAACEAAARATGATILGSNFHPFGEGQGVSGVVLLAESHLSIHTWPEFGLATLDVYVCGDCDPELAIPVLLARFAAGRHTARLFQRGALD